MKPTIRIREGLGVELERKEQFIGSYKRPRTVCICIWRNFIKNRKTRPTCMSSGSAPERPTFEWSCH
jgi:hypothetical protein